MPSKGSRKEFASPKPPRWSLDQLRDSDRNVVPVCSYAVAYLDDNPDQHDLLA